MVVCSMLKRDVYAKRNLFDVLLPQNGDNGGTGVDYLQFMNCCFINITNFESLVTVKRFKIVYLVIFVLPLSEISYFLSGLFLIMKFATESLP